MFGARTVKIADIQQDEALLSAPRGFTWRPLRQRSSAELRDMAQEYDRKAATATTREIRDALQRLGRRCDDLAEAKDSPQ